MNRAAAALALILLGAAARTAPAQDPRLLERLEPETARAAQAVVDSAHAVGLPSEPLIQRALEGAAKNASGARIVAAVRDLARLMDEARSELGTVSSPAELVAGADALSLGATRATLRQLRSARPEEASLTAPLVALVALFQYGVAPEAGADMIVELARAGVNDASFAELGTQVAGDIRSGMAPTEAARARSRQLLAEPGRPPPEPEHP